MIGDANCFDHDSAPHGVDVAFSDHHHCRHHNQDISVSATEQVDFHLQQQQQMAFAAEEQSNDKAHMMTTVEGAIDPDANDDDSIHRVLPSYNNNHPSNWDATVVHELLQQDMISYSHLQSQLQQQQQGVIIVDHHHHPAVQLPNDGDQNFGNNPTAMLPAETPDLLNLFHLAQCSAPPSSSSASDLLFANPNDSASAAAAAAAAAAASSSVLYDPLFHLSNLQPQAPPPLMRELMFQYGLPVAGGPSSLFGGSTGGGNSDNAGDIIDEEIMYCEDGGGEIIAGIRQQNRVLEFGRGGEMERCNVIGIGKRREGGKVATKHFTTERDRRTQLNQKYVALKNLIPNPTKGDRASVVGDAIEYIKELLRTVDELKLLVEKKRWGRHRSKKQKVDDDGGAADGEISVTTLPVGDSPDQSFSGTLRSSWLQRKSKVTEVDVRIIDDEVTIKLVQRKKINCLLHVSRVLDELQLDLHHVAGGHIGEHYSFLFNTKIYEGSSVYAGAIASKLIEVVDRQYAATPPPSSSY